MDCPVERIVVSFGCGNSSLEWCYSTNSSVSFCWRTSKNFADFHAGFDIVRGKKTCSNFCLHQRLRWVCCRQKLLVFRGTKVLWRTQTGFLCYVACSLNFAQTRFADKLLEQFAQFVVYVLSTIWSICSQKMKCQNDRCTQFSTHLKLTTPFDLAIAIQLRCLV